MILHTHIITHIITHTHTHTNTHSGAAGGQISCVCGGWYHSFQWLAARSHLPIAVFTKAPVSRVLRTCSATQVMINNV